MAQNTSTNDFGSLLKQYRRTATDPQRGGPLTQERLGELLGEVFGGAGYTGGAISEWERNKSKIEKDQRKVLVALIGVLHQNNGITCRAEADQFLLVGNYRPLDEHEAIQIFQDGPSQPASTHPTSSPITNPLVKTAQVLRSVLQNQADSADGILWHEAFLNGMSKASDWLSAELVLKGLLWLGVGWLSWQLISPVMIWPFENTGAAWSAAMMYSAGAIIIPLLIAGMCRTDHVVHWQQLEQVSNPSLRFFTHLGASVGYQVGTMTTFAVALLVYNMSSLVLPSWLLGLGSVWALFIGLASARQIPHNQWRAYHRLVWKDAGVFAIFFVFGPFCGIAFYLYYPWLLSPFPGILLLVASVIGAAILSILNRKKVVDF